MHHPTTTPVRPTVNTNETPPPTSTCAEEIGESTCNTNSDDSVLVAKKAPNFKVQEDVLLARAYANVTTDPVHGTDQKSDMFWSNVLLKYNILMNKQPKALQVPRTSDSLRLRWQRTLNKDVQLFNACYSRLLNKNPSGWNEEKIMEEAKKMYTQQSGGKEFKYEECYQILQTLPKFDPMRSTPERSICTSPTNCDGKVMGEDMERPAGTKKAKKMMKHEYEEASVASSLSSFQSSMVDVNNRFVDVMERKQRHDVWLKQAQFYQALGNIELAMEYMRKIEMDQTPGIQKEVHSSNDNNENDIVDNLSQIDQFAEINEDDFN